MTVSTQPLCRSKFAKFSLLAFVALLAIYTPGQTAPERSISDPEVGSVVSATNSVSVPRDTYCIPGTTELAHRLLSQQEDAKRKPKLPVSVIDSPIKEPAPPISVDVKSEPEEGLEDDNLNDEPSWHPFDRLPKTSRFLKEDSPANDEDDSQNGVSHKFHWKPAILQSLLIQGLQHTYALTAQEKTRRALKGPFFRDYWESIKGVRGWTDGNKFFTNYIAHPMQGGMTGFIFVQNHDRAKKQKFAESKQYWKDRFKAFLWSTAWSTNWELGPISQSSIGNVGLYGHQGYVDLVVTPTVGTGWLLTEEALDRYVIRHIESKSSLVKILARLLLNPMRSVANVLRFKEPWYRDRPFGH